MTLTQSVDTQSDTYDVSSLWSHSFPSADLVRAAGALFTPLPGWDGSEGPRRRIVIAPGVVQVSSFDPARAARTAERAVRAHRVKIVQDALAILADDVLPDSSTRANVTSWSPKSRARMTKVLAQLDYAPLFADPERVPAMATLTYPGDWFTVAPNSKACKKHVTELRKRYARAWGAPLIGVWKREFQSRGAPHYHIHMVPPRGEVNGESFRTWLSRTWAEVVAHPDPEERRRHQLAGTGLDYAEGMRASDPKRLAIYFAKHGAYGAKEYQNLAPVEWAETGSVGRFWGVWGLDKALTVVEVTADEAIAAARVMRRWARANSYVAPRRVWRSKHVIDPDTHEVLSAKWHKRTSRTRVTRMPGQLGFICVNDGPVFASQLARYIDQLR